MRVENGFQITPYTLDNAYLTDPVIRSILKRTLPTHAFNEIDQDLTRLGHEAVTTLPEIGARVSPPQVVQYDQWGRRIDDLQTSEGWRELKAFTQKEGIPAIAYERKHQEHSRSYLFAKVMLMTGDAHMIFCPISMTDGSARVLELLGSPTMKQKVLPRLLSRDPSFAFTAGQWMTERPGGSDVSRTETVANPSSETSEFGPVYHLDGFKWFSSATDSNISVALARTGTPEQGSRGLSLFLIPLRLPLFPEPSAPKPSPTSNNIFVHRLKNKIGTIPVPTAELSLESAEGYLIGQLNQGVKSITPVLNITRLYSAAGTVGGLRKCLAIATAYANVRSINQGKQLLADNALHVSHLASINLVYRGLAHMTFGAIRLLGKAECGVASKEELDRLKILTPTAKAFVAELAPAAMEDAMSCLGGLGYMEETGIGRLIRDALVEKIWEGTITVLALDVVRAIRDPSAMISYVNWAKSTIDSCPSPLKETIADQLTALGVALDDLSSAYTQPIATLVPRTGIFVIGHVSAAVYLLEHAIWSHTTGQAEKDVDVEVFRRWVVDGGLIKALAHMNRAKRAGNERVVGNQAIVFGNSAKARL
ncbi:hypothetical protein HGRIS_006103 [Hohenbuehelia grisea]|uniref:Acyl-CoA dehydrogenase n=1 Tax=Hohenbuehelia grisea TaxID=104357 RepID=A0ABR3JYY8_9AGAR